jgi:hypothetical protein
VRALLLIVPGRIDIERSSLDALGVKIICKVLLKNNDLTNPGRKYAQSEASEKISEASPLPRKGPGEGGGPGDGERRTAALGK